MSAVWIYLTAASREEAVTISRALVEEHLAACANVFGDSCSFYWWEGKVCRDAEVLLVMKTAKAELKALEKQVLAAHPYDTPEFVVLPIEAGSKRYLDWIGASTD